MTNLVLANIGVKTRSYTFGLDFSGQVVTQKKLAPAEDREIDAAYSLHGAGDCFVLIASLTRAQARTAYTPSDRIASCGCGVAETSEARQPCLVFEICRYEAAIEAGKDPITEMPVAPSTNMPVPSRL